MAKIKTGTVDVPDENFKNENIMAHISLRLPLTLIKELKRLSLNAHEGRYQVLIRDLLSDFVKSRKSRGAEKKLLAAIFGESASKKPGRVAGKLMNKGTASKRTSKKSATA